MNHLVSLVRVARRWATPLGRAGAQAAAPQAPDTSVEPAEPAAHAPEQGGEQAVVDAAFEAHVEEALRIIRSAPTLTVVTLPDDTRAARL